MASTEKNSYRLENEERATYRRMAGLSLPRHTSYPTVPSWSDAYGAEELVADLKQDVANGERLALYVHVPFCQKLCHYCACNKLIVPKDHPSAGPYVSSFLAALAKELDHLGGSLGRRELVQLHLGGGTPTYLSPPELVEMMSLIEKHFSLAPGAEMSAELDPRVTTREHLAMLRQFGFNRLSLGVQDFDPRVQAAINRIQPLEMVESFVAMCREMGFASLNFDLIYGLPYQTLESMEQTLDRVVGLSPDRIAFYRLALIPEVFKWQRTFSRTDVPDGELPLDLNLMAINRFLAADYEFIGLDHFAKPQDGLAAARRDGSLRRTFQGMTTGGDVTNIGIGPSAISWLSRSYSQSETQLHKWSAAVDRSLPVERGLRLTDDDCVRRAVLQDLYCWRRIDKAAISRTFGINFDEYFAAAAPALKELAEVGLIQKGSGEVWTLTRPLGELLVRVVAAVFDRYLPPTAYRDGLPGSAASKVG